LGFYLEQLGAFIILSAAIFAVLARGSITGGTVGLSITYALQVIFPYLDSHVLSDVLTINRNLKISLQLTGSIRKITFHSLYSNSVLIQNIYNHTV